MAEEGVMTAHQNTPGIGTSTIATVDFSMPYSGRIFWVTEALGQTDANVMILAHHCYSSRIQK